ncbi:MAG: hypothetical protein V4457_12830 [Pseudomonadota bacterium]
MSDFDQARAVIERGRHAADLLANPSFVWIINEQTAEHVAALIASPPGPSGLEKREYHHLQQHALSELVLTLTGYAETGKAQADALEAFEDETEDTP